MESAATVQQGSLFVRQKSTRGGEVSWDAQWRYRVDEGPWKQKTRRLGPAWLEPDGAGGWRRRAGRCPDGYLDERHANSAALAAMDAQKCELERDARERRRLAQRKLTVRDLASEWLEWLEQVRGAKPSTLRDYEHLLREPGVAYKRGTGVTAGRIMRAFGDRPYDEVTASEISSFLRQLDREDISPRTVNKHRQVLSAIFSYACRADSYGLAMNPVSSTDKRREDPPAALDYYEVAEVELLADAVTRGAHRWVGRLLAKLGGESTLAAAATAARVRQIAVAIEADANPAFAEQLRRRGVLDQIGDLRANEASEHEKGVVLDADELAARVYEDHRDADALRLLLYTGLRLGELLALRWADVDLEDRTLLVRRAVSAGEESVPKGRRFRFVPLSRPAVETLVRLGALGEFVDRDDYVLCNRYGRRLDGSALRRRYKQGCEAAGLRPVKLHGLRHAAGSLVARTNDAVFVRDFLGHAKLTTTDRYVSAKLHPEEFERLDLAFGVEPDETRGGVRHV